MTYIYARQPPDTCKWEYALVRYADDGTFLGVTVLSFGRANVKGQMGF
jgi:hypothetical protein